MGQHLHFDCFCGVSGDMPLGALVALGVSIESIAAHLKRLPIGPFGLRAEKIMRHGIQGTRVHVEVAEDPHSHRHLRHILEIIDKARSPARWPNARPLPSAYAEARPAPRQDRRIDPFHEVGEKGRDPDVTGAMLGVELLGADSFSFRRSRPAPAGSSAATQNARSRPRHGRVA